MKRALHPARRARHNSGASQPFRKAALGSNADASAVCGWRHQERRGNQTTAQLVRKAVFAANNYTAKRMIDVLFALDAGRRLVRRKAC